MGVEVDDLIAETWFRIVRTKGKNSQYNPEVFRFRTWLYRIALNIRIDHFRRHGREVLESELDSNDVDEESSFMNNVPAAGPDPEEALEDGERKRLLRECLQELPERTRMIVG